MVDDQAVSLSIQKWTGYVGEFYNRMLNKEDQTVVRIDAPYTKRDNIAWFASHRHISYPSKNDAYQYSYMFIYAIDIPAGAKTLALPANDKIKLFAVTAVKDRHDGVRVLQPLYDDFSDNQPFQLR
jgi:alpha-mannosidase